MDVDVTIKVPGRRIACKFCGDDSHFHNKCPSRTNQRERQTRPLREHDRLEEARAILELNTSEDFAQRNRRGHKKHMTHRLASDVTEQHQQEPSNQVQTPRQQETPNASRPASIPNIPQDLSYAGALNRLTVERNEDVAKASAEADNLYLKSLDEIARDSEVIEKHLKDIRDQQSKQREKENCSKQRQATTTTEKTSRVTKASTKENTAQPNKNRFDLLQYIDDEGNLTSGSESHDSNLDTDEETEKSEILQEKQKVKQNQKGKTKQERKAERTQKRSRKEGSPNEDKQAENTKRTKVFDDKTAKSFNESIERLTDISQQTVQEKNKQGKDVQISDMSCNPSVPPQPSPLMTAETTVTTDRAEEDTSDTGDLVIDLESRPKAKSISYEQGHQIRRMAEGIQSDHLSSAASALLAALDEPEALSNTFSMDHYIDDSFAAQHLGGKEMTPLTVYI